MIEGGAKVKKTTLLVLMSLLAVLTACGGEAATTKTPVPPSVENNGAVIVKRTAPELVQEVLDNPNKYALGTMFQVSGTVKHFISLPSGWDGYRLGPAVEGFYVTVLISRMSISEQESFTGVWKNDRVTVRGKYDGFYDMGGRVGVVLKRPELVAKY